MPTLAIHLTFRRFVVEDAWFAVVARLLLALILASGAVAANAGVAAQVVFVAGVARIGNGQLVLNQSVQEGDRIVTGVDGYIYLKTIDDGFLILRPNSDATIVAYTIDKLHPENSRVKLELATGVARSISGEGVKQSRQNFRFNTPVAAIGVRGTDFTVFTDRTTSRIAVVSGGVIVTPFSGGCRADGGGPCEGATSRELFANQIGQLLQVNKDQAVPQLLRGSSVTPEGVAPARPDEPAAKVSPGSASGSAGTATTSNSATATGGVGATVATAATSGSSSASNSGANNPTAPSSGAAGTTATVNTVATTGSSPATASVSAVAGTGGSAGASNGSGIVSSGTTSTPVAVTGSASTVVSAGAALTTTEVNVTTEKDATLQKNILASGTPVITVVPIVPPPAASQIIWGRWQAVLDQGANIDVAKLGNSGANIIAINNQFALLRQKAGEWQVPHEGSVGFALQNSEAYITDTYGATINVAKVENGKLNIDFGKATFTTSIDLVNQAERFALQAKGAVTANGLLNGDSQFTKPTNMDVSGVLGAEKSDAAAYLFQARIDADRSATGITYWTKALK